MEFFSKNGIKKNFSDDGAMDKSKQPLYCMAEVEPNWVIVLALVPKISHSLFRTGTEKINLTKNLTLSIDKDLVRDIPMELVTKAQVIIWNRRS